MLVIPVFILDFLCIHPFNDGIGRMSRLLTLLLLYQNGYHVGKYISIEKEIERNKDLYYDALQASDVDWQKVKMIQFLLFDICLKQFLPAMWNLKIEFNM